MKRVLLLVPLVACAYDASDDAIWRGTISRGGDPLTFLGFDPLPAQGFQFGGGIESEGYIDDPADGKLLVFVALHTDCGKDDFLRNEVASFPIVLPITDTPLSSDPSCLGMDLAEQPASTTDSGDGRANQTFHHEFDQHQTGTASGMFTVTSTDYQNVMEGRLQATVMDPSRGNISRTVDLEVNYNGNK